MVPPLPHRRPFSTSLALLLVVAAALTILPTSARAQAVATSTDVPFTASDGTELRTTVTGRTPLEPRPVIVEFSPYGRESATLSPGPDYNVLLVQIRGTGDSDGSFDALGPRTQLDVAEVLGWACHQSWSDGNLGLNGFSASAITVYNSLHLELPCVRGAVLKSGTFDLYRDLIYPGGIQNLVPAAVVVAAIGGATVAQSPDRIGDDPTTFADLADGQIGTVLAGREHTTLDQFWQERRFRGDVNDLPILMIAGFFDVESRGAFEAFQELRDDGSHLMVVGAHDGAPAGTDGGVGAARAWLDRWVRDIPNHVEDDPPVQLWLADGSYEALQAGRFARVDAEDWPVPNTRWASLALDPTPSGTAGSLNDGTLATGVPGPSTSASYPAVVSLPNTSDPHNFSNLGPEAWFFSDMRSLEPLGLSWTTAPFEHDLDSAGPAALEIRLSSTAPRTGIWAVLSDVDPQGKVNPVAAGRLLNAFPEIDPLRSRRSPTTGDIVQPYGVYDSESVVGAGEERLFHVELWPIGNRFRAGHRLRLHLVGSSALYEPTTPGSNTVTFGGDSGSRLLLPVLSGSDLPERLPATGVTTGVVPASSAPPRPGEPTLPVTGSPSLLPLGLGGLLLAGALARVARAARS